MQPSRKLHFDAAKQILRYVNFTLDLGLLCERDTKFVLYDFIGDDFNGDSNDRRSTWGYVFSCGSVSVFV